MNQPRQEGEIHRADPAYKRQLWGWFAFTLVSGAIALFALDRWLASLRGTMGADQGVGFETWTHRVIAAVCVLLAVGCIVFGTWLRRIAQATARERRWPPSTMRTSQDVRVRYLTSADALVQQFRLGAIALFVVAAGLVGWAAYLMYVLGR
jgi:hypothetical protein